MSMHWWSLGLTAINVHCGCEGRKQAVSGRNIADRFTSASAASRGERGPVTSSYCRGNKKDKTDKKPHELVFEYGTKGLKN